VAVVFIITAFVDVSISVPCVRSAADRGMGLNPSQGSSFLSRLQCSFTA
jgi:hypothetical protein